MSADFQTYADFVRAHRCAFLERQNQRHIRGLRFCYYLNLSSAVINFLAMTSTIETHAYGSFLFHVLLASINTAVALALSNRIKDYQQI